MADENTNDLNQALFDAAAEGSDDRLRQLLDQGADPGYRIKSGWSVLHNAARDCSAESLRLLIERGASADLCDNNSWSVLHCAAAGGRPESIVYLADELKQDVNAADKNGWTVLHSAAASGALEAVNTLLERGADPAACDHDGNTILHSAAGSGSEELVRNLIEQRGADPAAVTLDGETVLHKAVRSGSVGLVRYLVDHQPNSGSVNDVLWTALCIGSSEDISVLGEEEPSSPDRAFDSDNQYKIVNFLLARGADINAADEQAGLRCTGPCLPAAGRLCVTF